MTREEIEKDPWFGNQREAVLALLDRAEKAEKWAATLERALGEFADALEQHFPDIAQALRLTLKEKP